MKKIMHQVKKNLGIIKILFFISILFIVIRELLLLGKSISYNELVTILGEIAPWKILLMFVTGFIAVLPMIGYDWILNQSLEQKISKRYLLQTSWMINTVNNVAGFGGFISIGLRSHFYGKDQESKKMARSLSKVFLFIMSGLSLFSLIALILSRLPGEPAQIQKYWPWLLGGSLYFPLLLIGNVVLHKSALVKSNAKEQIALICISVLEWTGVLATFLVIGYLMGISFALKSVLPLFISASVIGILSMIPGALGSFDLMMLLGLTSLGISKEVVASWLLLYRLFYFVLPFLVSFPLFAYTTGTLLNERYEGVPKRLLLDLLHKTASIGYYVFGILLILSNVLPVWFDRYAVIRQFHPSTLHVLVQVPNIIFGLFFVIVGRGLAAKVERSFIPALLLNGLAFIYCLYSGYGFLILSSLVLLSIVTVSSRKELFRKQFVYAWEWLSIDLLILGAISMLYLFLSVEQIEKIRSNVHPIFWQEMMQRTGKFWLLSFLVILFLALFSRLFIRYLQGDKKLLGQAFEEKVVEEILQTYGGNLNSQLVFLKDKRLFIYEKEGEATVFFQFGLYNSKCIVMGDPSGKKEDFSAAIEKLIEEGDLLGYTVVFYEVSESFVFLLHEYGYDFFKMGEEARISLPEFTLSGKKMKGNRALVNKLTKEGSTFEVVQPPYSREFIAELKVISDAWLGSRKEKGFSLGFFSADYLQRMEIAIVRNEEKEIIAFANLFPAYDSEVNTIDLMRHHPEKAPSGTMDFLFIHLFEYSREQGIAFFSLGMAPLANVGVMPKSFIQERVAHLVYQFGSRFYSFQGLRKYKAKYATKWVPSYLLYHRETWILYVMIALLKVDGKRENK